MLLYHLVMHNNTLPTVVAWCFFWPKLTSHDKLPYIYVSLKLKIIYIELKMGSTPRIFYIKKRYFGIIMLCITITCIEKKLEFSEQNWLHAANSRIASNSTRRNPVELVPGHFRTRKASKTTYLVDFFFKILGITKLHHKLVCCSIKKGNQWLQKMTQ